MRRKFKVYYGNNNANRDVAGKEYKTSEGDMLVMNSSGVFYVYNFGPYYPYITLLSDKIGTYDVVWSDQ